VIPRTAVLGAILLTGYLGGAIATHVRIGEPFYIQFGLGVLVWLGLYLRDARLRALLPLRS
jgi:DoxX-like family